MRFLLILTLVFSTVVIAACSSPSPNLATPARPPLVVPTAVPTVVGVVTATAEPANAAQPTTIAASAVTGAAPVATEIPVAPVAPDSRLVGSYSGILPAADAIGRVVTLDLAIDGTATMTTQFIGKGTPSTESGTWVGEGDKAVVTFTLLDGQPQDNRITWTWQGSTLVTTEYDQSQYGSAGLPLTRVGTGDLVETSFGGVSFSFDSALAQSAQGAYLPAVPVQVAPALGGGAPEGIRFLFNGQTLPEYFDPTIPQVYVYPVEGLKALDPSVAEGVASLEKILADGTVAPDASIFVFPLIPSAQAFHAQTRVLDFVNGTGVSFITYYAQDVAPLRSQQVFWTFQGITLDGKNYLSVFWNIGSPALPQDRDISGTEYDAFAKEYENYVNEIVTTLDSLPPAAFTPNLSLLENMVRSMNVTPNYPTPTPAPPTPEGTPEATAASAQAEATPAVTTPEAQPSTQAQAVPPAAAQAIAVEHNGSSLSYDSALAQSAQGVTVPASPVDPNVPGGLSMGGPEHTAFAFNGETLTNEVNPFQPQVRVYAADALKALDPTIAQEVIALKTLLSLDHKTVTDAIPVIPPFNAEQVIHPQLGYLKFKDGEGVRFVTTYAQNPAPITNDGLFYTFQGLSTDGETYVSAFWPLRTDKLPNTYEDAKITDDAAFLAGYEKFKSETATMLDNLPADGFTPNLAMLDQMIESLTVRDTTTP